jgi:hypothetical protein
VFTVKTVFFVSFYYTMYVAQWDAAFLGKKFYYLFPPLTVW